MPVLERVRDVSLAGITTTNLRRLVMNVQRHLKNHLHSHQPLKGARSMHSAAEFSWAHLHHAGGVLISFS